MSCSYCSTGSNGKFNGEKDMSFDEIVSRVLEPAYKLGTRVVEFSGGEFMLREDAYEILDKANNIGFKLAVASNGTSINENVVEKLKSLLGDNIFISLGVNSFSEENTFTRDQEYQRVVKVVSLLEKHHIGVNICITFGKFNEKTVKSTIQTVCNMKLPFNRIPYVPRNSNNYSDLLDKKSMREFFYPAMQAGYNGMVSFTPFFLPDDYYKKISDQSEESHIIPTNPSIGCWCGSFYSVNPEGEVSPCALLSDHISGGNVLLQDLKEILFHSEVFQRITDRKNFGGKCGKCRYRFTCGGCRAMAYYHNNDLYGEDPTCFIDELSEEELLEQEKITIRNFKNYLRMAILGKSYFPPENT